MQAATSTATKSPPGIWRPTPGPQERFVAASCFEVLFGGSAGGGKSDGVLFKLIRHIDKPSYAGLALRRTYPELIKSDGLVERSRALYPSLGGIYTKSEKTWRFPSGARIEFGCMEREDDVQQYKSSAFQVVAFDELTTFLESQYRYMPSRMRSAHGIPLQLVSTSNPDGPEREWVLKRFAPWLYPRAHNGDGVPFAEEYDGPRVAPEKRLYYAVIDDEEQRHQQEKLVDAEHPGARGRTFIPSTLADNPYLAGTEYEHALDLLDEVTRRRLKFGDWMARSEPGIYFSRSTIPIVDTAPGGFVVARVRYFDRAGTDAAKTTAASAWTAGVRMSLLDTGLIVIEHVVRGQWDPGAVDQTILTTARSDPRGTVLAIERDPGQAGKSQAYYDSRMLAGLDFVLPPPKGSKEARMRPFSAQARQGNVVLVKGAWNEAYLRELEGCPAGLWDQIDSSGGGMILLLQLQERALAHRRALGAQASHNGRLDRASLGSLRSGL